MSSLIQTQVKKLLEPYVELSSADFSISLRNSTFRNVRFKRNCLMQFGFPLEILSGVISSLEVSVELSSKRIDIRARDIIIAVDSVAAENAELRAFLSQLRSQKLEKDASECLVALKSKPNQKDGWLSRKATAYAQAVVDNLIFGVENISIKYREFTFAIGSMQFEPTKAESSPQVLFSKIGRIAGIMVCCSALGKGSEAKPLVFIEDIDLKLIKGKAEDGYTMRLHCGIVKAEAEPVALRLGIRALTDFETLLLKCSEERGAKHLTASQESEYCDAFRAYLLGSAAAWKPHLLETIARESIILKLRSQVLLKLKAITPLSSTASQLSCSEQAQQQEQMFDFEMFQDGVFSKKWKPQKGVFRNGVLWTGSSQKSIAGRMETFNLEKNLQHNFQCLDCIFDDETSCHSDRDHVLSFKTESNSKQHMFAFSSATARLKCLEGFTDLPAFDDYANKDSVSSVSVSFFAELDGIDILLRASQNELCDCAKVQIRNARFELENRVDDGMCVGFSIENLYGFMALEQPRSSFVFLNTSTLHRSSNDSNFISVTYNLSSTENSLEVKCLNSTDICVNPLFQDFLHSWWEFAKSDRSESGSSTTPIKSSSAPANATTLPISAQPSRVGSAGTHPSAAATLEPPLNIIVTVHAPRCIFVSGNQALIICLGTFKFGNVQSCPLQLEREQLPSAHYQFVADDYSVTHVTFSDSSMTPDCTTDFSSGSNQATVIAECPLSVDLIFPNEALNPDTNLSVRIHFSQPLYLSLDHAFVAFAVKELLPTVNRISVQSAIMAEFFLSIFNGNKSEFSELTHEQQKEMLARLRLEQHPDCELLSQQYELARESDDINSVLKFCVDLSRIHNIIVQKEITYSITMCFEECIGVKLKMSDDASDLRASIFRISFPSKNVEIVATILAAKIDIALSHGMSLDCRILTADGTSETDFISSDVALLSAKLSIRGAEVSTSLDMSSESLRASVSPQQVEFFAQLFRGFQAVIADDPSVQRNKLLDADPARGLGSVAGYPSDILPDGPATKTTHLSVVVKLLKIEVDLKSDVHERNQQLKLLCEEIVTVMESTTSEFDHHPSRQLSDIKFSMKNVKIRSFCSSIDGLDLVHVAAAPSDPNLNPNQIICVHMTTKQIQLQKSSSDFISENTVSIEGKRPLIFVIDAPSLCKLYGLSMQLASAAGNPDIVITSTYILDLSFATLSLDLIISDEKHFRLSFCLPQDGSKSTNCVVSGSGSHRSEKKLLIGNMMFGVVLIPNSDLWAASRHSQIIDNVSFSVQFDIGERISAGVRILGGIDATISYQDLQQLYLFLLHPSRGLLVCWIETNGNLQPAASSANPPQPSLFEFHVDIPAMLSLELANDCPPYSETLLRIEMQQVFIKLSSTISFLSFENLLLSCGLDSHVSFEKSLTQYRERVGEIVHGFVTGSVSGVVCGCGNMYSDDSDVATAAVHSGFCGAGERKKVCIQILGSVDGLSSSRSNGVSSRACAHWPGSFSFVSNDTVSPTSQLLAVSKCRITHNALDSAAEIESSSKLLISVSLPVVEKLRQRMDYVLKDWEGFQSEDHPHQYSGHVYARLHNKSDSLFAIRHLTYGPQRTVARFEHVDLDQTWFPKFVLIRDTHEVVVDFQDSAFPGLHFEFQTHPDPPRYRLFVYSQVIFENRTCLDFVVQGSGPDGAVQALLPVNQRFSTSTATAETCMLNIGACGISCDLRSLPVHSHSVLARDCPQSIAFGCIQHEASKLFWYPEGGHRLILKAMADDNQEGYLFRLCRDGSLQHVETGFLVHPEGGAGVAQAQLVLHDDGSEPRLWFALSQGCIRHLASGLHVHPAGGRAAPNMPIMLHPDGPDAAFQGQLFFNFVSVPPKTDSEVEPEPEVPSPDPQPCSFLRHTHTAMYVHPEGGTAVCGARLVLWPGDHNNERRLVFSLRADGNLQHVDSGLFVHPKGGRAKSGIELILHPDGPEPRLAFDRDTAGCFRHRETGLYVHPKNGKGSKGCALMFHPDDASRAYPGELYYALEPAQVAIVKIPPSIGHRAKLSGNLRHVVSHLYIHPEGGAGVAGTRLVLHNEGNQRRLNFVLRLDGCIQHSESRLFVHPRKGSAKLGVDLILHPDGPRDDLAFEMEPKFGCLRHIQSGLYVHPAGGEGKHGVHLILHNDGPEQRLVYDFMPLKFDMSISNSYHGPIALAHVSGIAQHMWCCSKQIAGGAVALHTYVPSLFVHSELARACEIELFNMGTLSLGSTEPLQLQPLQLATGATLPFMSSRGRMGLRVSLEDGFLTSNIEQISWEELVVGRCHAFRSCSVELRGEGGLSKWLNLYWSMTEHGAHVLHIAQTIDVQNMLSFPLRLCLSEATETSPHMRISAFSASNPSAVSIGLPSGWQFDRHRTLFIATETNAEAYDFQKVEIPLDSHSSGILVFRGARFRVHVELHFHPAGQRNPTLCFFPQHCMINASGMPLRVLSQDAAASCIDIPPASAAKTSTLHALPIFWEGNRGGFSIACKVHNEKCSGHEWSRFHALFTQDKLEATDVVFRDDDGRIVGCVSLEVIERDADGDKKSIIVIVRESSAVCR